MIRPAEARDAEAIACLWNWMIRDTLATFTAQEKTLQDIEAMIAARPGAFFVADRAGQLAGFVTFGAFRAGDGYARCCEHSILVDPRAQANGLGRALMLCACEAAAAQDLHVMVAAISGVNTQAIAFHERLGFTHGGRLAEVGHKNGRWLDLVLMQKILHGAAMIP